MKPFIVTELEAGKLPRWGLLLLCALYTLPGLIGRDPWRTQDAAGFGIALSMMRGDAGDWLMPNIANLPVAAEGPLPFWIAALVGGVAAPVFGEHAGVRLAIAALLTLTLVLVWYTIYRLARRPGVQPSDPFGASASQVDYGRAIADSGLLVLMATFGLIVRMHETTGDPAQVAWIAAFLFGCALALDRPAIGAAIAGAAIAATLSSRGAGTAVALLLVLVCLPLASRAYRLVGWRVLPLALAIAIAGALPWPLLLASGGAAERGHLLDWAAWNLGAIAGPTADSLHYFARTAPWFFWPAWPVALWAAWRWRGRWGEPAIALPMLTASALTLRALASPAGAESWLLPVAVPMAMLAAVGVPTLKRGIVSLIDWFAVTSFSLFGVAIWTYWIALMTGYPPRMAYRASRIAPDFTPEWIVVEIALGGLATLSWLLLVRWRVSRQPPMIWRAMVLSCGGLVLAWFLLMTLWLPVFNERNTYREVASRLAFAFEGGQACVDTRELERAPRASFHYFAHLRFASPGEPCDWLLIQDDGPEARAVANPLPGWTLHWQGQRRSDRDERFRLYRRNANRGASADR